MGRRFAGAAIVVLSFFGACASDQEDAQTVATPPAGTDEPIQAADCQDLRSGPQALIEISDYRFDPPCAQIRTGQGFTLRNNGENVHNFSVEDLPGVDVDIEPGQENNTEPPGLEPDEYTFFCKYHRDQGMEGELRVSSG